MERRWMISTKSRDGAMADDNRVAKDDEADYVELLNQLASSDSRLTYGYRSAGQFQPHEKREAMANITRGPRSQRKTNVSDIPVVDKWMWRFAPINQYNLEDFQTNYENAKFYVIKSIGEDDIHKSIKYNVWSSTNRSNRKIDDVFHETQDDTSEAVTVCPIFLFFSVNGSGQFVGVAEMIGKVDFAKTLTFWQSEDWNGFFPVKWHIIKDVPNTQLSHIIIESIDSPVTKTRDMQEIGLQQGLEMLKVFKNYTARTSMLDDFNFYEKRELSLRRRGTDTQLVKQRNMK